MSDLEKLVESLADLIADKVVAKLASADLKTDTATKIPDEANPPDVSDTVEDKPKAKRTRKSTAKKEPEPEPEEEPEEEEEESEEDIDLPTAEQLKLVAEGCAETDIEEAKSDLLDYYVSQGHSKKEASATLAQASDKEIAEEFVDFSARLLALDDKGKYGYIDDLDEPYKAHRLIKDEEVVVWVSYATTLTSEEIEELDLGPAVPEVKKKKATRKRTRKV